MANGAEISDGVWESDAPDESGYYWVRWCDERDRAIIATYENDTEILKLWDSECETQDSIDLSDYDDGEGVEFWSERIEYPEL